MVTGKAFRDEHGLWAMELDYLWQALRTSPQGLTSAEALKRLEILNPLRSRRRSAWYLLLEQFKSPIILLLLCSAILSFVLIDDATNGWIIVCILLAGGLLGFWQELSAADAVARLAGLIETKAVVVRDGTETTVSLDKVVPGDIVRLRAGDLVPGDCRLLEAKDLFVNESTLTGESFPTEKSPGLLPLQTALHKRTNGLFLGTHVVSGFGSALVVATGGDTELGKISASLESHAFETGFERGLRHFGQLLIKVVIAITAVVFLVKVGLQDKDFMESLLVGLALAVGMTPQLLPAVTSVVLAAGAKEMAKHQVIVKQLLAIENLGSMTLLCSDKTGTLTEGEIKLHEALDVEGRTSERVSQHAYLNAFFQSGFANPIDRAILSHHPFDTSLVEKQDEIPYDFTRKRLSVRVRANGVNILITKGAFENVLAICPWAEMPNGELVDIQSLKDSIKSRFESLSEGGLRVLGIAIRSLDTPRINKDSECEMTFLGFLAFADPPKSDAKQTISELRDLGVGLKIITGDNRATAASISRRVGIQSPRILTGVEMLSLDDQTLQALSLEIDIFAEIEPNQKEQIIVALKKSGQVVGYLGDGINDASALHAADVGISVASAVDVAREAAQIVLLKQDLRVLVRGVSEGRKTFSNTLKYVFFAISANFGYMLSLAIASLFLPFEPLLASQILLVNLLADFPAMAMATDSVDPELIHRPRRWDTRLIVRFMITFGVSSSVFDFMTFGAMYALFGLNEVLFHTGWFIESTLTGLMIMMVVRTSRPFFLSRPGKLFIAAITTIAAITLVLPYSPLSERLGFVTPPRELIFVAIGITILYGFGLETVKSLFYRYLVDRDS